jgi:hypothetical protein
MIPNNHSETKWGIYSRKEHTSIASVQSEASWLSTKLNGDNPILVIHPQANNYTSFTNIVSEPYVREESIAMETETYTYQHEYLVNYRTANYAGGGQSWESYTAEGTKKSYPKNPNEHFKPLDIIWINRWNTYAGVEYYHVGIYLGLWDNNHWICNLDGDNNGIEIITWQSLEGEKTDLPYRRELIKFHPIIPFKDYKQIVQQISWTSNRNWRSGTYCLSSRNCEHAANMLVLGIDFSKQVDNRRGGSEWACWFKCSYSGCVANKNKTSICLRNGIKENNSLLEELNNQNSQNIKEQYEARIEQPVNIKDCVIM